MSDSLTDADLKQLEGARGARYGLYTDAAAEIRRRRAENVELEESLCHANEAVRDLGNVFDRHREEIARLLDALGRIDGMIPPSSHFCKCGRNTGLAAIQACALTALKDSAEPAGKSPDVLRAISELPDEQCVAVQQFWSSMVERLVDNKDKGGWDGMGLDFLFGRLFGEVWELLSAIQFPPHTRPQQTVDMRVEHVVHEAADVANFAMMIADEVSTGRLVPVTRPDDDAAAEPAGPDRLPGTWQCVCYCFNRPKQADCYSCGRPRPAAEPAGDRVVMPLSEKRKESISEPAGPDVAVGWWRCTSCGYDVPPGNKWCKRCRNTVAPNHDAVKAVFPEYLADPLPDPTQKALQAAAEPAGVATNCPDCGVLWKIHDRTCAPGDLPAAEPAGEPEAKT